MLKPIIILDVDGVLNPLRFNAPPSDFKFEPAFISSPESGSFTLNLSREMGQAIQDLGCEIRKMVILPIRI